MFSLDDPKSRRRALLIAGPLAVLVGVAVFFMLGGFGMFQPESRSSYQVIDEELPVTAKGDQMAARLNKQDPSWQAEWIATPTTKSKVPAAITLDVADSRGIITNVGSSTSVQQHGALLLVWDGFAPDVVAQLKRAETPFAQGTGTGAVQRFQMGTWVAYYAPGAGAADRSKEVKDYLTVVSWCPYNTKACPEAFEPRS